MKIRISLLYPLLVIACGSTEATDDNEPPAMTPGPTVEFDPANGVIPQPSNLVLDTETGTLDIPSQCNESAVVKQIREQVINQLDGFGTFKPLLQVTFSESPDIASLEKRAWLVRIDSNGMPDDPSAATPIPLLAQASQVMRYDAACANPQPVAAVTLVPTVPLDDASTYALALTQGITTAAGTPFGAALMWSLVRQSAPPVTVEGTGDDAKITANNTSFDPNDPADRAVLLELHQLWNQHSSVLSVVEVALSSQVDDSPAGVLPREQLLVAGFFTTQTVEAPLDSTVSGSPAAVAGTVTTNDTVVADLNPDIPAPDVIDETFCELLGLGADCNSCALLGLPCAAVGFVKTGQFVAPNYQVIQDSLPTLWTNPRQPDKQTPDLNLDYLAFIPAGTAPASGWPIVIFGHGLTGSRNDLFLLGPQLAAAGLASISINWVLHGERAVQISDQGPCANNPAPSQQPQCFAPITSADVAVSRDNLRQSVLDAVKLIEVLKACGTDNCGDLALDSTRIGYIGISLGAIIGTTISAVSPDIKAAVLNVGGVGMIDITRNSETPAIVCPVVDALIAAGILEGQSWQPDDNPEALCLQDSWKTDPAFQAFANTGQWVLDPFDGANFVDRLVAKPTAVLLQKVVGDAVVPNVSTDQLGDLLGLTPMPSNFNTGTPAPTAAAAVAGQNLWLTYETQTQGDVTNTYQHASLLAPSSDPSFILGTAQMQLDAITFLTSNL